MQDKYNHIEVERAAHDHWAATDAYRVVEDSNEKKFYACSMLPYPSGKLHMGHVRNYTINDMLTRQLRMKGYNVLMPMGWDAFGLPAENAALKNKVPPAKWTYDNIAYMKKQMQAMGLAIDWSREISTCDPEYYKWNQWLFLKMLDKGIAYRKTQVVNWDPVDQTVLANEQVIDGRGWRTGALVEKREIPGYYLAITNYAQELLDHVQVGNDKATLTGWPDKVRLMQENWIGKSAGVRFAFTHDIQNAAGELIQDGKMYVFTTRADTIMGVTFCAVAPEHPLALHAAAANEKLAAFIEECKKGGTTEAELAVKEKEGMPTGLFVTHPLTGAQVEVWVGNYVLMSYGDGAVMGVPAHDERDFAFAKKYDLPIQQVVAVDGETFSTDAWQEWYGDKQKCVCVNSGALDGLTHTQAVDKVAELVAAKGLGEKKTPWRLRDWGISRQRYWGTPIPIIHCADCGAQPQYFWPKDVEHVYDEAGKIIGAKLKVEVDSADGLLPVGTAIDYEGVGTMSKSKNNGIDPQELIEKYGADTARLYTMFTSPPELTLEWSDSGVEGSYRFLRRVYNFGHKLLGINYTPAIMLALGLDRLDDVEFGKDAKALRLEIHTVLKQVDYDYQRMQYNTVVSGAMKMINALESFKGMETADGQIAAIESFGILLRVLYPATPHLTHMLWKELGYANKQGDLLDAAWPEVDPKALVQDELELMLQVNGKLRGAILVPASADKAQIEAIAVANEDALKFTNGATPKKVIVVPGRLVNIVV
nr:leucine--tRNA ligase [Comamonas jiangduensis]